MRFAGSQGRVLDRMERTLLAEDPRLGSLFAVFTRLTRAEAMAAPDQVRARRGRPPRAPRHGLDRGRPPRRRGHSGLVNPERADLRSERHLAGAQLLSEPGSALPGIEAAALVPSLSLPAGR